MDDNPKIISVTLSYRELCLPMLIGRPFSEGLFSLEKQTESNKMVEIQTAQT